MGLSLKQLRVPVPEDQMLSGCLGILDSLGFQATSWQAKSASRILVQLVARLASEATYAIVDIAGSMHAGLAKGAYADDLGTYTFDLPRVQATATVGTMVFTSSPAAPISSWLPDELLIADSELDSARTYRVIFGGTINPGDVIPIYVEASIPGTSSNIPPNIATLVIRGTPLVGVTVSNPPIVGTNTWITVLGTDAETDGPGGRYNARMIGRWNRMHYGNIEGAYYAWCLEALPALLPNRLSVTEGAGEGVIHIVGATAAGPISPTEIGIITDYLNGVPDGVGRRPINDILEVVGANLVSSPPLNVSVTVQSPFSADAVARVTAALDAYVDSVPIGGTRLPGSSAGRALLSELYQAVMNVDGVLNVYFPGIGGDVYLQPDDVWEPPITVVMTIVP